MLAPTAQDIEVPASHAGEEGEPHLASGLTEEQDPVPGPRGRPLLRGHRRRRAARAAARDAGMTTAEYAVGTVAAAGFAAVLLKVVQSGGVRDALADVVQRALSVL